MSQAKTHRKDKVVKILAIGNSFSEDAIEQNLYELAEAQGIQVVIGNMVIGGCTLERHLDNMKNNKADYVYRKIGLDGKKVSTDNVSLQTALQDEEWDYVSLQQSSALSGMYESYEKTLPELIGLIRPYLPKGVKLALHQTWAYEATSDHDGFKNYGNNQLRMYNAIIQSVKKAAKANKIKIVIPVGTAIQNTRTSPIGDHLTRDGHHLDLTVGRYVAACTWYATLFKENVLDNSYAPAILTAEQAITARLAASAAVEYPDRITPVTEEVIKYFMENKNKK